MSKFDELEQLEDVLASLESHGWGDSSTWWGTMKLVCDLRIALGLDEDGEIDQ